LIPLKARSGPSHRLESLLCLTISP
jgi:hypothetical protein